MAGECFCHFNGYEVKDAAARLKLSHIVKPQMFGATGDGITDDAAALRACIASDASTICFSDGVFCVGDITFPKNKTLLFTGGILKITGTATVEGFIYAGRYSAFDGDGSVIIKGNTVVYPEWFGAACDGETDDSAAINKAIQSVYRGTVLLRDGAYFWKEGEIYSPDGATAYHCENTIIMNRNGVSLEGTERACIFSDADVGIKYQTNDEFVENSNVKNILIGYTGTKISGSPWEFSAIVVENASRCRIENVRIQSYGNGVSVGTGNDLLRIGNVEYRNPNEGYSGAQFIGLYMYGTNGGFVSSIVERFCADFSSAVANTIGILIEGSDIRDIWLNNCEVAKGKMGISVNGDASGMAYDIRITNFVHDQTLHQNIRITDLSESGCIEINGGYLTGAASAIGAIEVVNSPGTRITNVEIQGSTAPNYTAIDFIDSEGSMAEGNRFVNCARGVYSGSDNIVAANNVFKIQNDPFEDIDFDFAVAFENNNHCVAIGNTIRTTEKKYARGFFCTNDTCKFIGNAVSSENAEELYSVPETTEII